MAALYDDLLLAGESQMTSAQGNRYHCPVPVQHPRAAPEGCLQPCPLGSVCVRGEHGDDPDVPLEAAAVEPFSVARDELLFEAGASFEGLYVVRAGAFKNTAGASTEHGQVVDFRLPGDVLGMAAMAQGIHPFAARALEASEVCRVRMEPTDGLCLHPDLVCAMSVRIRRIQWLSVLLRTQNAEQGVIHFLLDMAHARDASAKRRLDLHLPMSRKDIANYLGVAVETVSRTLHRLQDDGLLHASGRNVRLLDIPALAGRLDGS